MADNMPANAGKRVRLVMVIALIPLFLLDIWNLSQIHRRMSDDKRKRRECNETVTAEISDVDSVQKTKYRRGRGALRGRRRTYYVYRASGTYEVNGYQYTFTLPETKKTGEYYVGKQYTLKYNKADATDYYIVGIDTNKNEFVLALIRMGIYVIFAIFFLLGGLSPNKVSKKKEGNFRRVSSGDDAAADDTWKPFDGM